MRRALLLSVLVPLLGLSAPAQAETTAGPDPAAPPAMLVADRVYITPQRTLIATGNVEAFQGDMRLQAQKISYDQANGTLEIEGPIRIDQGGDVTILASSAELDRDLQNGLLSSARMVFKQQRPVHCLSLRF